MDTSRGGSAADMTPSGATGAVDEPGRALPVLALPHSRTFSPVPSVFERPVATGVAGGRGDDLAGAAPRKAQRIDLQAGQFVKRASFARSAKEIQPAIPGHGNGPLRT
jgi:hypothetical protein